VDAKPDVVIKGVDVAGGTAVPIVTGAGLAYVTANAGQPVEVNTDGAFSLTAGFAAQFASVPQYAKDKGYKSIGVIYTNVSALSTPLEGPIKKLAAKEGLAYYTSPVDITSGDLTPAYSALLSKHVDALLVVTSQGQCAATLKARQSLADTTPLLMSSSCNVTSVLNTVPASVTNGTLFALLDTSAVPDDPDTKIYEAKMKAYQPKAQLGGFAPSSFEEIMDLYAALKKVPDSSTLNATTVKTALKQSTDVPLFMGGGKTFSCSKVWFEGSPSVCTGTAFLVSYSNGTYTDAGAFDAADLLKGI
jgi:branched-chain amino acid transport system substrate-binding protein